jgi:NADPH:quinone reductase-like Zn-dependent oxidoreductase
MKVVRLSDSAAKPALVRDVAPRPEPGRGEVLIRVCAAAVMPTELLWYPTSHTKSGARRSGAIPGHEFSGVVVDTREEGGEPRGGSEVFGMNDWFSDGAMAEYCVAPVSAVAPKPRRLSHAEAASVPISALTAWQGLLDRARVQAGERVLVHGGAGAVGAYAVQLARLHGARVIATASAGDAAFVKELGAEQVIDYRAVRFEQSVSAFDVVFDTVGGETLQRSWSVLTPQGRIVTIASAEQNAADPRSKEAFFIVEPSRAQLTLIANLLDTGELRAIVDSVVPLSRAPEAYAGAVSRQHRGKLVVSLATNESFLCA